MRHVLIAILLSSILPSSSRPCKGTTSAGRGAPARIWEAGCDNIDDQGSLSLQSLRTNHSLIRAITHDRADHAAVATEDGAAERAAAGTQLQRAAQRSQVLRQWLAGAFHADHSLAAAHREISGTLLVLLLLICLLAGCVMARERNYGERQPPPSRRGMGNAWVSFPAVLRDAVSGKLEDNEEAAALPLSDQVLCPIFVLPSQSSQLEIELAELCAVADRGEGEFWVCGPLGNKLLKVSLKEQTFDLLRAHPSSPLVATAKRQPEGGQGFGIFRPSGEAFACSKPTVSADMISIVFSEAPELCRPEHNALLVSSSVAALQELECDGKEQEVAWLPQGNCPVATTARVQRSDGSGFLQLKLPKGVDVVFVLSSLLAALLFRAATAPRAEQAEMDGS